MTADRQRRAARRAALAVEGRTRQCRAEARIRCRRHQYRPRRSARGGRGGPTRTDRRHIGRRQPAGGLQLFQRAAVAVDNRHRGLTAARHPARCARSATRHRHSADRRQEAAGGAVRPRLAAGGAGASDAGAAGCGPQAAAGGTAAVASPPTAGSLATGGVSDGGWRRAVQADDRHARREAGRRRPAPPTDIAASADPRRFRAYRHGPAVRIGDPSNSHAQALHQWLNRSGTASGTPAIGLFP